MLKLILVMSLLCFSLLANACWKTDGQLSVDGESWKFSQKVEHKKEYLFPLGTFILKFTITPEKGGINTLRYTVEEKKGVKLNLITTGEDEIRDNSTKEIYAKGVEGQPHSIITIKLSNI